MPGNLYTYITYYKYTYKIYSHTLLNLYNMQGTSKVTAYFVHSLKENQPEVISHCMILVPAPKLKIQMWIF